MQNVEIRKTEQGSGLFALRDIKKDTIVLVDRSVVWSSQDPNTCQYCLKTGDHLMKCPACQHRTYCSKTCFVSDKETHLLECNVMKQLKGREVGALMAVVFRILSAKKATSLGPFLENCTVQESEYLKGCLSLFCKYSGDLPYSSKLLASSAYKLLCKLPSLLLTACNEMRVECGSCLLEIITYINHSCVGNCEVLFLGPKEVKLLACKDIKENEQFTISYICNLAPREVRVRGLKEQFGFECKCDKCIGNTSIKHQDLLYKLHGATEAAGLDVPSILPIVNDESSELTPSQRMYLYSKLGDLADNKVESKKYYEKAHEWSVKLFGEGHKSSLYLAFRSVACLK